MIIMPMPASRPPMHVVCLRMWTSLPDMRGGVHACEHLPSAHHMPAAEPHYMQHVNVHLAALTAFSGMPAPLDHIACSVRALCRDWAVYLLYASALWALQCLTCNISSCSPLTTAQSFLWLLLSSSIFLPRHCYACVERHTAASLMHTNCLHQNAALLTPIGQSLPAWD